MYCQGLWSTAMPKSAAPKLGLTRLGLLSSTASLGGSARCRVTHGLCHAEDATNSEDAAAEEASSIIMNRERGRTCSAPRWRASEASMAPPPSQQPNCWRSLVGACNSTRAPRTPSGCAADLRLAPAARALGRCVDCGLPQRHETCHRLAHELLARRGFGGNLSAVALTPARAAVEAAEYERALSELHRSGRCRWAPCAAEPPPSASASLGATAADEPTKRLLLGLTAFVPRAARAAQQAEAVAEASPELLHEWAALVQQRLELTLTLTLTLILTLSLTLTLALTLILTLTLTLTLTLARCSRDSRKAGGAPRRAVAAAAAPPPPATAHAGRHRAAILCYGAAASRCTRLQP